MQWELEVGREAPAFAEVQAVPMPQQARKKLAGTVQQEAFWKDLLEPDGNTVLSARAGTGKSASCREGMWRIFDEYDLADLPRPGIRYSCFNRAIADDFRRGCPDGVEVATMHSFSWRVVSQAFGCKQPEPDKSYKIMDTLPGGTTIKRYFRRSIARLVGLAKNQAFDPRQPSDVRLRQLQDLIVLYDVECYGRDEYVADLADDVLQLSADNTSSADFDDQLWLAWLHQLSFPHIEYLFIDEAQDCTPLQHALIPLMNRSGRTIVVGDPFQAIYGFRGADSQSLARLEEFLLAEEMKLTVSFRCPHSHAGLARELVADFQAHESNQDGTVLEGGLDRLKEAKPGDMVICRSNAPLLQACLRSISERRPAFMRGRAIGDQLDSIVRRLPMTQGLPAFCREVGRWADQKVQVLQEKDGMEAKIEQVRDQEACLLAVADACQDVGQVSQVLADLFSDDSPASKVCFSSVHRAKGSEAERVFFIDVPYPSKRAMDRRPEPAWQAEQRRNLRYVALTRSLDTLAILQP